MSKSCQLTPNLDPNTTKILNLTVLQRIDPNIEEILFTASHVTFYAFDIDSIQWSRKNVEGSLFIVKRSAQPLYQFIVLNRLSTDNLVENLIGDFKHEVQSPYLLYQNDSLEVNGIWFYNSHEREEVTKLFSRILSSYSKVPPEPEVSSSKRDFEQLETAPSMPIREATLEPSLSTPASDIAEEDNTNLPITDHQQHPPSKPTLLFFGQIPVLFSNAGNVPLSPSANSEVSSFPVSSSMNQINQTNSSDPIGSNILMTNLVKPSLFTATQSSSSPLMRPPISLAAPRPSAAALHTPSLNLQQRPYGTALLHHLPTHSFSSSLVHIPSAPSPTPIITRDQIREALLKLVQEDQFIDMICQALHRVHNN